ncbi:MAG: DUF58 domain-containing protein [Gammaproteobacteria bacterium]
MIQNPLKRKIQPTNVNHNDADPDGEGIVQVSTRLLIELHRDAKRLPLKAANIKSRQSGQYQSPFKGRGMEFDESRLYQPGDDVRALDWRVTARTGQAHTKLFREERERSVLVWVDYRKSMFFATRGVFKSVVATKAAALIAWSATHHGDRIGGLIFSENQHDELRPLRGKKPALHLIQKLSSHSAWDRNISQYESDSEIPLQALIRLRRVAKPGSLICLITDFRNLDSAAESQLRLLRRHNDVILLQIGDPLEMELPPPGVYRISDGTSETQINTFDKKFRDDFIKECSQHQAYIKKLCQRLGIYYLYCSTEDDLTSTLAHGLGLR